jgi:hypothetical protein
MTSEDFNALDAAWRKSTRSNGSGSCVEAGQLSTNVLVRDTKNHGRGPVLEFTPATWRLAVKAIKTQDILK